MQRHLSWVFFGIIIVFALAAFISLPGTTSISFLGFNRVVQVVQGLDLKGGVRVLECAKVGANPTSSQMNDARNIIESRVSGLGGLSAPQVSVVGNNCIDIELPGVKDPSAAIKLIGTTGNLVLGGTNIIASGNTFTGGNPPVRGARVQLVNPPVPPDSGSTPQKVQIIVPGKDVNQNSASVTFNNGLPVVDYTLNSAGSAAWGTYTTNNVNHISPVVLDGHVIVAPSIQGPITGGSTQVTGLSLSDANNLAAILNFGALPVALHQESSQTVSATLGASAIHKAKLAAVVGLILVMLFMVLYYRLPGLVADLALIVYACVVFSLFKILPVTLTLPGIAGFILSIGMAVDANVLIFERCKEELRAGKTLGAAIDSGFNRAWTSIRDSNISTIITTIILYWFGNHFGTTIITGFASTLFIGVVISMFTAIIVTRTFLRVVVASGRFRELGLWGVTGDEVGAESGLVAGASVV